MDEFVAIWDGESVFGNACEHVVAFCDDADDASAARFDFLEIGECFFVCGVFGGDDDDGESVVDECDGAVFHFAGWICFGVNVCDFFEFKRAFECDGVVYVSSEVEE